jgi:hypothetical protein
MLNAIAWSAHIEVPKLGVESSYVEREEITVALAASSPQLAVPEPLPSNAEASGKPDK